MFGESQVWSRSDERVLEDMISKIREYFARQKFEAETYRCHERDLDEGHETRSGLWRKSVIAGFEDAFCFGDSTGNVYRELTEADLVYEVWGLLFCELS